MKASELENVFNEEYEEKNWENEETVIVDYNDDGNDLDALFKMGQSFKFSNISSFNNSLETGSNDVLNSEGIFEDAVTREIKIKLREKIKEELMEDFVKFLTF